MPVNILPYLFTFLSGLLGGSCLLTIKIAADYLDAFQILAVRWTVAFIVMTILAMCRVIRLDFRGKSVKFLILLVLINPCIAGIGDTNGVAMTTASEAGIIFALMPFVVVILGRICLGIKIQRLTLLAIFLATSGVVLTKIFDESFSLGGKVAGYLCLFLYMVCWAIYALMSSKMPVTFTAMEITYMMAAVGTVWFNAITLIRERSLGWYAVLFTEPKVGFALFFMGAVATAVAYLLLNYAVCRMPAAQNNMIYINTITVSGVVIGVAILGDSYGWYTFVGMAILIAAVILANIPQKQQTEEEAIELNTLT